MTDRPTDDIDSLISRPDSRGGARPGSGRPRKDVTHARPIAKAEKRIADRLPGLIDVLFDLAMGVKVEETNAVTGELQTYQRPPDRASAQYLIDRVMGKPTERQEAEQSGSLSIEVRYVDHDHA